MAEICARLPLQFEPMECRSGLFATMKIAFKNIQVQFEDSKTTLEPNPMQQWRVILKANKGKQHPIAEIDLPLLVAHQLFVPDL